MGRRVGLMNKEWSVIEPLLPNKPRGVPRVDDRPVLNGIFRVLHTGALREDMPERYGPLTTVCNRFMRWRKAGVWKLILDSIQEDIEDSPYVIDSSVVRIRQRGRALKKGGSDDEETGRSRGVLTTKLRAITDNEGHLAALSPSLGQAPDLRDVPS
ncbi:MAG: IS5 family transposase [Pseudomonadota bacterium]